jgi:hypothetical protein
MAAIYRWRKEKQFLHPEGGPADHAGASIGDLT